MNQRRHQQGFMLLEVMLATALLAVGLFALINALSQCLSAARSVQNYSTAQVLLANKSYEFHVERAGDVLDQEGSFEGQPQYSWSRRFEAVPDDTIKGLWKQTIEVVWTERGQTVSDAVVEYRYLPEK